MTSTDPTYAALLGGCFLSFVAIVLGFLLALLTGLTVYVLTDWLP